MADIDARVPLFGGGRFEWCATTMLRMVPGNKQYRGGPEREVTRPVRLAFRGKARTPGAQVTLIDVVDRGMCHTY